MEDQTQQSRFIEHTRKMLKHVLLDAILWVNIARHEVSFRILEALSRGFGAEKLRAEK